MSKDRKRAERRKGLGEQYVAEQAERAAEEQAAAASKYRADTMAAMARAAAARRIGVDLNKAVANTERVAQEDQREKRQSKEALDALEEHLQRGLRMSRSQPLAVFDLDAKPTTGASARRRNVEARDLVVHDYLGLMD